MWQLLAGFITYLQRLRSCDGKIQVRMPSADHDLEYHRVRRQLYLTRCRKCGARFVYDSMDNVWLRYDRGSGMKEEARHLYPELRDYNL